MAEGYDFKEVSRRTGVSESTIRYWVDEGLVVPEIKTIRKSGKVGKRKLFSIQNIIQILILRMLSEPEYGMKAKKQIIMFGITRTTYKHIEE